MGIEQILVLFGLLGGLFIFSAVAVYFNRKTPMPENCFYLGCDHCDDSGCHYTPMNAEDLKAELLQQIRQFNDKEGDSNE